MAADQETDQKEKTTGYYFGPTTRQSCYASQTTKSPVIFAVGLAADDDFGKKTTGGTNVLFVCRRRFAGLKNRDSDSDSHSIWSEEE
jgi:hypothetical protein